MRNVYTIKEIRMGNKRAQFKANLRNRLSSLKNWVYNNKELILVVGPIALGVITTCVKVVGKRANLRKEKDLKDLYCYDRSLGHYWRLRRELSNAEWVEIDKRKSNGERLADILSELKVLK